MIRIELSPFDEKDILELLDYAKEMKEQHRPQKKGKGHDGWDDTDYWLMRIEQLKEIIKSRNINDNLYGSSLPEGEPNELDKRKEYYRKVEKKNDLFNGKDYYVHNNY